MTKNEGNDEKEVATLGAGDFFGDKALISEEKRSANIYAKGYTKCYTLDRLAFINLVGKVSDDHKQDESKEETAAQPTRVANETIANSTYDSLEIIKVSYDL